MQDHSEVQQDIPAYVADRLDETARRRLEIHLTDCVECESLVVCCEEIAVGIRGEADPAGDHPDPLELRELARREPEATEEIRSRHLEHCASCALEVSAWKRAPDRPAPVGKAPRRVWALAGAASLGAAAMLMVMLALGGLTTDGAGAWSGFAAPLLLEEPSRGAPQIPTASVVAGQPYLPLLVQFVPSSDTPASSRFVFTVRTAAGRSVLRQAIAAGLLREALADTGAVGLLLPLAPDGERSFQLTVSAEQEPQLVLMQATFEIAAPTR